MNATVRRRLARARRTAAARRLRTPGAFSENVPRPERDRAPGFIPAG